MHNDNCENYHCRLVRMVRDYRGQILRAGVIEQAWRQLGYPSDFSLPNDHSRQLRNPSEPPNLAPYCDCFFRNIPIFTRIARGQYRVNDELYWHDSSVVD